VRILHRERVSGEIFFKSSSQTSPVAICGQPIYALPASVHRQIRAEIVAERDRRASGLHLIEMRKQKEMEERITDLASKLASTRNVLAERAREKAELDESVRNLSQEMDALSARRETDRSSLAPIEEEYGKFVQPGWRFFCFKADGYKTDVSAKQRSEYDAIFRSMIKRLEERIKEADDKIRRTEALVIEKERQLTSIEEAIRRLEEDVQDVSSRLNVSQTEMTSYLGAHPERLWIADLAVLSFAQMKLSSAKTARFVKSDSQGKFRYKRPSGDYALFAAYAYEELRQVIYWECVPQKGAETVVIDNDFLQPEFLVREYPAMASPSLADTREGL
jgi:hypothetical protein